MFLIGIIIAFIQKTYQSNWYEKCNNNANSVPRVFGIEFAVCIIRARQKNPGGSRAGSLLASQTPGF